MALRQSPAIDFSYIEAPPTKWTFEHPAVRRYVEERLEGRVLNLFAGKTTLRHSGEVVRVDIDPNREPDHCIDAEMIDEYYQPDTFDTVILDPPYNVRKAREKYGGEYVGKFTLIKDKVTDMVRLGGTTLHFGYDSTGMSQSRGYEKDEIALINHKGDHNDTICVVETRVQATL